MSAGAPSTVTMEQIKRLRSVSFELFDSIDKQIASLDAFVTGLGTRLDRARLALDAIRARPDQVARLCSPAFYPAPDPQLLQLAGRLPCRLDLKMAGAATGNLDSGYGSDISTAAADDLDKDHLPISSPEQAQTSPFNSRRQLAQDELELNSLVCKLASNNARIVQHPAGDLPRSISSLFVFYTNKSRLVSPETGNMDGRTLLASELSSPSSSSFNEPATGARRTHKTRSLNPGWPGASLDATMRSRTPSNDSQEPDLGPAPMLAGPGRLRRGPSELDAGDMLASLLDSSSSDPFSETLPDVLPSLSGVVRNVHHSRSQREQPDQGTLDQPPATGEQTFLSQFESLFKPLSELPNPSQQLARAEYFSSSEFEHCTDDETPVDHYANDEHDDNYFDDN